MATTYTLSPEERKARAQNQREYRENRYLYKKYLEERKLAEELQQKAVFDEIKARSENASKGFFVRAISTVGDVAANVITGAVKGLEGIYDLGAGLVGAVGGIFDSDFADRVKDHIAYDWTTETIGNPLAELTRGSYLYDTSDTFQNITRGVASGVGQMLPAVAVTALTGGLGAPAMLAQGLGTATFIGGAMGRGTEEAFNEGADFYSGLGYGIISGAIEGAIEKISGGMADKVFGKGLLDDVGKSIYKKITTNAVAQQGLKLLGQAGGEAAEEWVSELINPYLKRLTYNKDAELSTSKTRMEAALIGGLTSIAFQGTVGRVGAKSRNIQESLAEVDYAEKKADKLWGNSKLTEENIESLKQIKEASLSDISRQLIKSSDKARAKLIDKFNLGSMFNEDGTIADTKQTQTVNVKSTTEGVDNNAPKQLASPQNYNKEAYSASLEGKENGLVFKPTSEVLTEEQRVAKQDFTRLNKGKVKAKLVFTNELVTHEDGTFEKGAYVDGVLYINTKANAVQEIVKHELTHFAEGTKAYNNYANFVLKQIHDNPLMSERFGNLIEKIKATENLYESVTQGKDLSRKQYEVLTEVVAKYTSENLFTNEEQISRLARTDRNFFQKVIDWIKDKITYFNKKKSLSKEEQEVLSFLNKAEKLYGKALEEAWGAGDVINKADNLVENKDKKDYNIENEEQKNEEANSKETKYSIWREDWRSDNDTNRRRVRQLQQIFGEGKEDSIQKVNKFAKELVEHSQLKSYDEEAVVDMAKKLGIDTYFCKTNNNVYSFLFEDNKLFLPDNITTQDAGLVLEQLKPYREDSAETKVAHISQERWNSVLKEHPDALVMTIRIKDFLELSADKLAQRYIYNETGDLDSNQIKNTGFPLYLKVDFDTKTVIDHEGRHRMTALQKAGYSHADIFILPTKSLNQDVIGRIDLVGQKSSDSKEKTRKVALHGMIKADSKEYASFVNSKFRDVTDSNIRYSLDSSESFTKNHIEQAEKIFGYTSNFKEAGYLLPNGKMLNFSGEKGQHLGYRAADHRDINSIMEDLDGTDAMIQFMNEGNIRLIPESSGLDLIVEPTEKQYNLIKDYVLNLAQKNEYFYIDFSNNKGDVKDSIEYNYKVPSSKVLSDIKYYFNNGKVPAQSEVNRFRYSLSKNSDGQELTEKQKEFFKDTKVVDDEGNLKVVYHGTMAGVFNVFDASKANVESDMGAGFYFTDSYNDVESNYEKGGQDLTSKIERLAEQIESNEEIDYDRAKEKAEKQLRKESKLFEVYLNIKNPAYIGGDYDVPTYLFEQFNEDLQSQYNIEDFGDEEAYYEQLDQEASDFVDQVVNRIENEGIYDFDGLSEIIYEAIQNGGITIPELKEQLNEKIYAMNDNGDLATNEILRIIIEELGFDGVIDNSVVSKWGYASKRNSYMDGIDEETRHYVAFKPSQIKSVTNKNPSQSEDIRYSLSKGQVEKIVANKTKVKNYSKQDAETIINNVLSNYMVFGEKYGDLSTKTKKQVIDMLWEGLNSKNEGERSGVALDIANYIIENSVMEDVYGLEDNQPYVDVINALKPYLHKIDLTSLKGEIKHKYDTDNSPYLLWGKKRGTKGFGADEIGMYVAEEGIQIKATNEADIFFEIDSAYKNAVSHLKKQAKSMLKEMLPAEDLKKLKQDIAKEVLWGYDKTGKETEFGKTINKYTNKIQLLKEQLKDVRDRNKTINNLYYTIDKVKTLEKYGKSDIPLANEVVGLVKLLKKIKTTKGNLSKHLREIMLTYSKEVDGKKLYNLLANDVDGIINPVAQLIEDIAHKQGELSTTELKNLNLIMENFIHNINNYNKVFFEGRSQVDAEIAEQAIKETKTAIKVQDKGFVGSLSKFSRWLTAPIWRFERLSSYRKNGIMTKVFREFQNGVSRQSQFNMNVSEHYKDFFQKNKKIVRQWQEQSIDINGVKMSKGQMISLYLLSLRKQAQTHLFAQGDSGTIRLTDEGYASKGKTKDSLIKGQDVVISKDMLSKIKDMLSDTDKKFIKLTQDFFNKIARDAKYETDMSLFGISNVGEDMDYIPIRVADDQLYKEMGNDKFNLSDLFTVYSASFNKDTMPNAKNKIVVENIIDIVNRHTKQMGAYYGLAIPIKSFNRIYNKTLDNGSKLRNEISQVDSDFERYVGKLLSDLQGNIQQKTGVSRVLSKVRGLGAKAALGLNLKVLANQFVSLPASAAIGVKYRNIMKGFGMAIARKTDFQKLTQYSPMLYDRFREGNNIDVGLLKQGKGVIGRVDFLTDLTTAPIGKLDTFICGAVWNASLEQTKNSSQYENYSEDHYKAAAKLTEEAVIKTQANYMPLYRPAILRDQDSFVQLSTMFMSEPLQQFSILASAIDKVRVAKLLLKSGDTETRAEAEGLLKQAKSEAFRAISAVTIDVIILTLITQAFDWLKGNDDDEEDKVVDILMDFSENYIGMFPFIKDIYTALQGYDVTNMAYTGLTNTANAIKELYNIFDLISSGKAYDQTEINGKLRKVLMGITQMTGIPLRNLETYIKGIVEKFSPSTRMKYESLFYTESLSAYKNKLYSALERGDDKMADTILDIMLSEKSVEIKSKAVKDKMKKLLEAGLDVLPRSINDKITYNGEEFILTKRQQTQFKKIYANASGDVESLIKSKRFEETTPEIQAKSIKFIYDYYYNLAIEDLTGEEIETKTMLFAKAINIEDLAIIVSTIKTFESSLDQKGNVINSSKKQKVQAYVNSLKLTAAQKYMIMGFMGYSNTNGELKVKTYIQSLKLTKAQKELLFEMSGYKKSKG